MFNLTDVTDKYKILYLNDEVKNKFLTLVLMGIDNKYLQIDVETLNNTSEFYKEKLNKRCQKKFKENFNENKKPHLNFLVKICEVNLTINDLINNTFKFSVKKYDNTVYLVNKGEEYGLVLKTNKKSVKTSLSKALLGQMEGQMEKLSLEGGGCEPAAQKYVHPNYKLKSIDQGYIFVYNISKRNNGIDECPKIDVLIKELDKLNEDSYSFNLSQEEIYLIDAQMVESYERIVKLNPKQITPDMVYQYIKLLENSIQQVLQQRQLAQPAAQPAVQPAAAAPQLPVEYATTQQRTSEVRDDPMTPEQHTASDNLTGDVSMIPVAQPNYTQTLEQPSSENVNFFKESINDSIVNHIVNTKMQEINNSYKKIESKIDEEIDKWKKYFSIEEEDNGESSKQILENIGLRIEYLLERQEYRQMQNLDLETITSERQKEKEVMKMIKFIAETIARGENLGFKDYRNARIEELVPRYLKFEEELSQETKSESNEIINMTDEKEITSVKPFIDGKLEDRNKINILYSENIEDEALSLTEEALFDIKMNTSNISYSIYENSNIISQNNDDLEEEEKQRIEAMKNMSYERTRSGPTKRISTRSETLPEPSKRSRVYVGGAGFQQIDFYKFGKTKKDKDNKEYAKQINKYDIIDLLERGIDSQHDFGSEIKQDKTITLKSKLEIFETFNPEKIDEAFQFSAYPNFILSLALFLYDNFNDKVIKGVKNNPSYSYAISSPSASITLSIPFEPRITKRVNIDLNHNPFASGGWEKNAKLYYIAGNTKSFTSGQSMTYPNGYTGVNLFDTLKANNKKIIIFQDAQGASDAIYGFFNNIKMRPGSFYTSFDNHIKNQKKLTTFKNNLSKLNLNANLNKDDAKVGLYNILKNEELKAINSGIISSGNRSWFMKTPATAIDAAGTDYLDKITFEDDLDKINTECGLTAPDILELEKIWDWNWKNPNGTTKPNFVNGTGFNTGVLKLNSHYTVDYKKDALDTIVPAYNSSNGKNDLKSLYRLVCVDKNSKKINILDETYKDHFDKICDNTFRKNPWKNLPVAQQFPEDPFDLTIKINDIKFEIVLGEYNVKKKVQLWPILLMYYYKVDTSSGKINKNNANKLDIVVRSLSLQNLVEKSNVADVINIVYNNNNADLSNLLAHPIDIGYRIIYSIIRKWAEDTETNAAGKWNDTHITQVFKRILYTLKMMGDHGQVKFIKALKDNVQNFNNKFEVLFTTGDSLASLYACAHNVTNMSTVVTDFPSEEYCVSKPKGMVYYPSS